MIELVGDDVAEGLFGAAGPGDFDQVYGFRFSEAEVGSEVALRKVAAASGDLADLSGPARGDANPRAQGVAIGLPRCAVCERLLKFGVFGFGFFEDGYVGVGGFPECEKILIGGAGLSGIILRGVSTGELKLRKRNHFTFREPAGKIENFLELGSGFCRLV